MKRTLTLVIAVILVMSSVAVFASDYENHWVKTDAQYLIDAGIITPSADGNIKPDEQIIRGEFVVMINKIFRYQEKSTGGFKDVLQDNPYYADFLKAKKAGYITGNENGEAKPNDKITRAEVAVILARINKLANKDKAYPEADVPTWAFGAVAALVEAGIMKGNDKGEFLGYDSLTNAEAIAMGARTMRAMPKRGPSIYMVGDSTMQNYPDSSRPQTGWGEMVSKYMKENVAVYNHASGGRSTKSFIDEGRWDTVVKALRAGDYVVIQFGHNDQKADEKLHTDPDTTYKDNIRKFVSEAKAKGATPIICSSVNRRSFSGDKIKNNVGGYPKAAVEVATELGVFCVDLNKETETLFNQYGPEGSKKLFLFLAPGESPNFPEGKSDSSHFQTLGADLIAKIFAQRTHEGNCPLKDWINPEAIK